MEEENVLRTFRKDFLDFFERRVLCIFPSIFVETLVKKHSDNKEDDRGIDMLVHLILENIDSPDIVTCDKTFDGYFFVLCIYVLAVFQKRFIKSNEYFSTFPSSGKEKNDVAAYFCNRDTITREIA